MTDPDQDTNDNGESQRDAGADLLKSDDQIRQLLRSTADQGGDDPPDVLAGVQRKLRERSGGKFYGDRWSTERHPPTLTYLITSLLMLAVLLIVYFVLQPLVGEPVEVPMTPAPVEVLPPR
jgi:hypothetical protein